MRRSLLFLLAIVLLLAVFLMLPLHARHRQQQAKRDTLRLTGVHITDLCLTTEARYTRHPSLADRHAPFQDHPTALEHFPSGSLILPAATDGKP